MGKILIIKMGKILIIKTLMGKILIIKTLILPKFTFLASSCVVPKMYIKEIESCFYRFSWNGKPDKIKRLFNRGL
jgi:hypothetical protein